MVNSEFYYWKNDEKISQDDRFCKINAYNNVLKSFHDE